jgi:hypothetical protein
LIYILLYIFIIRCVDRMLNGIQPLADNILANLIKDHYPNWYQKLISVQYPKKVFII